jgi:hypothetical protein
VPYACVGMPSRAERGRGSLLVALCFAPKAACKWWEARRVLGTGPELFHQRDVNRRDLRPVGLLDRAEAVAVSSSKAIHEVNVPAPAVVNQKQPVGRVIDSELTSKTFYLSYRGRFSGSCRQFNADAREWGLERSPDGVFG